MRWLFCDVVSLSVHMEEPESENTKMMTFGERRQVPTTGQWSALALI